MSRPDRQVFLDKVDSKVNSLRGSGVAERHLRLGVLAAMEEGWPLRDAIVLREAHRIEAQETPRARAAWTQALAAVKASVPESTYRIWIKPIQVIGEDAGLLVLGAHSGIRQWAERRYSGLIDEAVRSVTDFGGVRFATIPSREELRI